MSHVELDVRAGPREKTDWKDQEESGLGVSLPTRRTSCRTWECSRPRDFCCTVVVGYQQIFGEATKL